MSSSLSSEPQPAHDRRPALAAEGERGGDPLAGGARDGEREHALSPEPDARGARAVDHEDGAVHHPPRWETASVSLSKISATANTCFSPMQSRLLSNAAPAMIDFAAFDRQAVASTTTGGLPGPATIALRLLARAARATAGPPVTTS